LNGHDRLCTNNGKQRARFARRSMLSVPRRKSQSSGGSKIMGINVLLKAEESEVLGEVCDPKMALSRATNHLLSDTVLLRYLLPWGDAIFNQAQAADLANDIAKVKNENSDTTLCELLSKVEPLVQRLASETHLYLWFMGD
jgi:hypothetical protein